MERNNEPADDVADLFLITDATNSMLCNLSALNASLPEIIHMSILTGAFSRVGVLAYRDYCTGPHLLEWSGWCDMACPDETRAAASAPRDKLISQSELLGFARSIRCKSGGDIPEATKTALAMAHDVMREGATTVTILYTDAPPHLRAKGRNAREEIAALTEASYGGHGGRFCDWTSACRTMAGGAGKKAQVHCITERDDAVTRQMAKISRLTIGILLAWMGVDRPANADREVLAKRKHFLRPESLGGLRLEERFSEETALSGTWALASEPVSVGDLYDDRVVRRRAGPGLNFAERYAADSDYKDVVTTHLRAIIDRNPAAMTANPIFGKLWRAVSGDRSNPARDELTQLFGRRAEQAVDADERARLKAWLEESYNYTDEIMERIRGVAEVEQFPCVYLDPTQDFTPGPADGEDGRAPDKFTRDDLLAIGRSCDYRVLRRLGRVLTRLTYVEKPQDLPQHIRAAGIDVVPRIPLALAQNEYERAFWRVLLHLVLPGTMLARRPAALLAALSLRIGIRRLRDVADAELLGYRKFWNTLDIPETWSLGCLSLLLDADDDFRRRIDERETRPELPSLLLDEDKRLFKTLVGYKMLELNLQATLTAKMGWTQNKTKMNLGPQVVCRKCGYPRSVTVMSEGNVCGLCADDNGCGCAACTKPDGHEATLRAHVRKDNDESSQGTWVECRVPACRAQYVVYNPARLNVPPKCFYCLRAGASGPARVLAIECRKCLNRVAYPEEYRPADLNPAAWECVACVSGRETIGDVEVTPKGLAEENGRDWLLTVRDNVLPEPLDGRSLYHTASASNLAALPDNLTILPEPTSSALTISGKTIHNTAALKASLRTWVLSRLTQSGDCTLCFSPTRKSDLRPACGRAGCRQLICEPCRAAWYGLNAPGRLVNIAALGCPFCRRMPAPGMVSRFGTARMGDARVAVGEAGQWIHAWCAGCGFARRYAERACEAAVSAGVRDWRCESCAEARTGEPLAEDGVTDRREDLGTGNPRTCPGCGVMTEKMMGCDHIACPCGVHWCYACGEEESLDDIYEHMAERHGGLRDEDDDIYL